MTPEHKAKLQAGGARFREDMRECVRLGLVVGYPGYLTPGETRITRARKELAKMKELDAILEPAGLPTHADKFREIHGKSLDFFDRVLGEEIEFSEDNAKLLNIQLAAASKTMGIGMRVAIELYRGQNIGALARLLERMKQSPSIEQPAIDIVGFEE